MTPAEQFFYANAGWSYDPKTETSRKGRLRCAAALALAEATARDAGLSFDWTHDDEIDSGSFSDERPAWTLWQCRAYDSEGALIQSLSGIDFGRDGSPHGDHYRRVVEAELAAEHFAQIQKAAA